VENHGYPARRVSDVIGPDTLSFHLAGSDENSLVLYARPPAKLIWVRVEDAPRATLR
jgi:hypothetical protein